MLDFKENPAKACQKAYRPSFHAKRKKKVWT